jgi:hypothetical protein
MLVTLLPAIATAILDPLFIFGLQLGLDGAAIVLVIARTVLLGVGFDPPVPLVSTSYWSPEAVSVTPARVLFLAR